MLGHGRDSVQVCSRDDAGRLDVAEMDRRLSEVDGPAVIIGKKIAKILNASDDLPLLAFAKDNLGAGVTAKRHLGMLKDLQFSILLRREGDCPRPIRKALGRAKR